MVIFALLVLYIVWGSTYFAMRVALVDIPPFFGGGLRFVLAGAMLLAIARHQGAPWPSRREWLASTWVGCLLLGLGNGLVGLAEHLGVGSGVAASVVATMPLWAVMFGTLFGQRPALGEVIGLLVGFSGVLVLRRGGALDAPLAGVIAIALAPAAWALGSVWSQRLPRPQGSMAPAAQMLGGGVNMMLAGLVLREPLVWPRPSALGAFVYLVVVGSLLGFTCYAYLLRTVRPAVATSYAYVNPVVALAIGALLGGEPLGLTHLMACSWTLAGVGLVMFARGRRQVARAPS